MSAEPQRLPLRERVYVTIFEADTPAGKIFDVFLLLAIGASVVIVMLDSMEAVAQSHGALLGQLEWFVTVLFTAEYLLRLWSVRHPLAYARSFFGIVDLMALLPAYLGLFVAGSQSLMVIRSLRLLRIFRVLKLAHFLGEARVLIAALSASRNKILVFLGSVLILTIIVGSAMYMIEGPEHGFTSIPRGVYWAIVTLTTVGYGDIHPKTALGQLLASVVMIMGYGIIAVPTGIVSVEIAEASRRMVTTRTCRECNLEGHDPDAVHCKYCGEKLLAVAVEG
ncbi:MAG: ion transporter [Myxococcales bacterium]|nr:ion transporter [Myxococcales bacterium]